MRWGIISEKISYYCFFFDLDNFVPQQTDNSTVNYVQFAKERDILFEIYKDSRTYFRINNVALFSTFNNS